MMSVIWGWITKMAVLLTLWEAKREVRIMWLSDTQAIPNVAFGERERERESIFQPLVHPLPLPPTPAKWMQWLERDWSKTRSQVFLLGLPHRCWGPSIWAILCFPKFIMEELNQKWNSRGLNWFPYGLSTLHLRARPAVMLVSSVSALTLRTQLCDAVQPGLRWNF